MNKRLVWNFEINNENPLELPAETVEDAGRLGWEARYFWDENARIVLYGLDDHYLNLALYQIKQREDRYALLPDEDCNVKQRRGEWLYKPLMDNKNQCRGFGKKINLQAEASGEILPGDCQLTSTDLLERIHSVGSQVDVKKTALLYKFRTQPATKLELARLTIRNRVWFSACLEGRSPTWVKLISQQLIGQDSCCDYVHFLKANQHD